MMFPTLNLKFYVLTAAAVVTLAIVVGSYIKGRSDGRSSLLAKMQAERIEVLKDGKVITDEVLNSSDDALCDLLGGC